MERIVKKKSERFTGNLGLVLVLTLSFGLMNKNSAFYNLIRDSSFEENSTFWEAEMTIGGYANTHLPDSTSRKGYYVAVTKAGVEEFGGKKQGACAELKQKIIPRMVKDFYLTSHNIRYNNLKFLKKEKIIFDRGYRFGVTLKSKQGNKLEIIYPVYGKENWEYYETDIYDKWKKAGLPETDILEEIILWSKGYYYTEEDECYGQEIRWDWVRLLSKLFDNDAAAISIDSPEEFIIGEAYKPKAKVSNVGVFKIDVANVSCKITEGWYGGTIVYTDRITIEHLNPNDTVDIVFKEWTPRREITHTLSISISYENDQNDSNDRLRAILEARGIEERAEERLTESMIRPSIFSTKTKLYLSPGKKIRIYDPNGKLVKEFYDYDRDGKISFGSTLKPGIYFYQTGNKIGKMVKIR